MNRRNKNKTAAATNPSTRVAQTPPKQAPPAKTTPPPEQVLPTRSAQPSSSSVSAAALGPSAKLRKEWKTFEVWLSARRAQRDKRVSEKLKELMSAKNKTSRFQKPSQPTDMALFEATLNQELAEEARAEWLKRLAAAGLNEEDWSDITEAEMKAVEAAFAPPLPSTEASAFAGAGAVSDDYLPSPTAGAADWATPVPGGWDPIPPSNTPPKPMNKRQDSIPIRSSPLSNGWGISEQKSNLPASESLWDMHMSKAGSAPKPPTPPSSTHQPSNLPTPDVLWEMHMASKTGPPPPPTPPTEPVSPSTSLWDAPAPMPNRMPMQPAENLPPRKGTPSVSKPAKKAVQSESLWERPAAAAATLPPPAPLAAPTYTGNSIESAHNHGYMSPLLIELEGDEFPLAPADILTDDLVAESIRQWHQQAAEADIQLRKQLVLMHWSKRDWDELLGSHVQEMEQNARTVVGHWKSLCDEEKERRLREDKQRRLAGIRNVTSGNRKWGVPPPVDPTPPPQPPAPASAKLKSPPPETKKQPPQPQRKAVGRKQAATVEDATSSEWEERSATPSLSTDRSRRGRKDSIGVESLYAKDPAPATGGKGAPGLMANLWGRREPSNEPTAAMGNPKVNERKKPVPMADNGPFSSPIIESPRKVSTPLPWGSSAGQEEKIDQNYWSQGPGVADEEEDDEDDEDGDSSMATGGGSMWGGSAAAAWNLAMKSFGGDKNGAPAPPAAKPSGLPKSASPPVNLPGSLWADEPFSRNGAHGPEDGRFTPWKPSAQPEADVTKKMADLALQNLYSANDDDGSNDLRNTMSMYTKSQANSNSRINANPQRRRK
ncbi:hypothetical protein BDW22DRAFT_1359078 [Trametopsis cervina]|nr:hypothetical protein BDW22DRAFT_1359078 [Trametopsis cervina]